MMKKITKRVAEKKRVGMEDLAFGVGTWSIVKAHENEKKKKLIIMENTQETDFLFTFTSLNFIVFVCFLLLPKNKTIKVFC